MNYNTPIPQQNVQHTKHTDRKLPLIEGAPYGGEEAQPGVVRERVVHVRELRRRRHQLLGAHAPRQLQELRLLGHDLAESLLSVEFA